MDTLDSVTVSEAWPRAQELLRSKVGSEQYEAWFARLSFQEMNEDTLVLAAPTKFIRLWLMAHFKDVIESALSEVYNRKSFLIQERNTSAQTAGRQYAAQEAASDSRREAVNLRKLTVATHGAFHPPVTDQGTVPSGFKKGGVAQKIVCAVREFYELADEESYRSKRHKIFVRPRQVAMYLIRKHTDASCSKVGRYFNGQDHTTVLNAVRRIGQACEADSELAAEIAEIEKRIQKE